MWLFSRQKLNPQKQKKPRHLMRGAFLKVSPAAAKKATELVLSNQYTYKFTVFRAFCLEYDFTISGCKQGMVFSKTDIVTGMKMGATLTDDNVTSNHSFTTETLYT
jgi:hypothetical protein